MNQILLILWMISSILLYYQQVFPAMFIQTLVMGYVLGRVK